MSRWQSEQSARQRKRGQKRVTGTQSSQKTFSLYADVVRRCTTYVELAQTTEANADVSREHIEGAAFGASWPIPDLRYIGRSCPAVAVLQNPVTRHATRIALVSDEGGRQERYRAKTDCIRTNHAPVPTHHRHVPLSRSRAHFCLEVHAEGAGLSWEFRRRCVWHDTQVVICRASPALKAQARKPAHHIRCCARDTCEAHTTQYITGEV